MEVGKPVVVLVTDEDVGCVGTGGGQTGRFIVVVDGNCAAPPGKDPVPNEEFYRHRFTVMKLL